MKLLISATALCLLMGVPAYGHQQEQQQQEQQDKDKQKQEEKQKQDDKAKQQDEKAKQDEKVKQDKQVDKQRQDQEKQQEQVKKDDTRRQTERTDVQRTQTRTISQTEFHAHFGREHHFRVGHVDNQRFAYGGYSFEYTEAWPGGWGYNDDFYIDYIDGQYYLIDLNHPGARIVLVIVG